MCVLGPFSTFFFSWDIDHDFCLSEVILAVLVSTFTFEHTEKEIKWNLAGIIYPSVGDEKGPSLPLKVGLVNPC